MKHNGPPTCHLLRPPAAVFVLGLIVVLAGCALRPRDTITYHAFDYPAPTKETNLPIPGTLIVFRFLTASSVDIDSLVISQSAGFEKSAQLYRWEDKPADMITELVVRDLESSGLFERTVGQWSSASYRYVLKGTIRNLQGVISNGQAKALIEVETALTDIEARAGKDKDVLKKIYRVEVPTKDATADSIIKGLDLAVKEFSERLRNDIRAAMEPKAPEPVKKVPRKAPSPKPRHKKTTMIDVSHPII